MAKGWHRESRRHALASKGVKTAVDDPIKRTMILAEKLSKEEQEAIAAKKAKAKLLEPFKENKWDEATVNLALRRINAGKIKPSDIFEINKQLYDGEGIELTKEQQQKGWDWLKKQHYTPTGKEKEGSPYGYREISIIDNPEEIRLKDFYPVGANYYTPVYEACGKDSCMEYYVQGGQISIIG